MIPNLQLYAIVAVVAVALSIGGYFYVDSLQSKIEALESNVKATEAALKANEDVIRLQDQTLKEVQAAMLALANADARTDRDIAILRRRVNDVLRVSNDPTTTRPDAEVAVNAVSTDILNRLRSSMTGGAADEGN